MVRTVLVASRALIALSLALAGCNAGVSAGHPSPGSDGNAPASGPAVAQQGPGYSAVPACRPEINFKGDPISAPAGQWTWVDVPGAICRDGSQTGIGVRLKPGSDKVVFYLEGGGACFHGVSCAINDVLQSFGSTEFGVWEAATGSAGIFDDTRKENPFKDWNVVYVPYCTGDVHAGDRAHVDVPGGPSDQMFVGYRNIGLYLQRLVPTFKNASHVVVTGISAGGFGAAFNYDRMAQAFCNARVDLVDDSGPPMSDKFLAPCLQRRWRDLWNMDATLPADCSACRGADGGGIVHYVDYLAAKYPQSTLGLISANQDSVISLFFGFGTNDCQGLDGISAGMDGPTFEKGIEDLANNYLGKEPGWGAYIVPSISHTWITALTFYNTTVSGMALSTWVDLMVNKKIATTIQP